MSDLLTPDRRALLDRLLAELVAIPSVNTGSAQARRDRAEERIAACVHDHLTRLGMSVRRWEVEPGRPNLLGRWDGEGVPLTLEAHVDTVGVDNMTLDPFAAEIRDGVLYGRGACDTKGSLAAFLGALILAHDEGWRFSRPVQLAAVMGEETGCEGALALAATDAELGDVVVGEPTGCDVVCAHKACAWFSIVTHGRGGHASMPQSDDNAIYLMRRVLTWLEDEWARALVGRGSDPLLGHATFSVGTIGGGEKVNIVPARCRIEIDLRLLPEQDPDAILSDLAAGLRDVLGARADRVDVAPERDDSPGFGVDPERGLAAALRAAHRAAGGDGAAKGVPYFTDAGVYAERGCDTVVFGPGDIRYAHGPVEQLPLAELHRATATLLELLRGCRAHE